MISTPAGGVAARPLGRDQQPANAIVGEQSGIGSETPPRINDGANRLRAGNLPDGQLRIVGYGRSNTDDDDINQRTQSMKVLNAGWTVDIFRMAGSRRDPTVQRLAELTHDNQIIHAPPCAGDRTDRPKLAGETAVHCETDEQSLPNRSLGANLLVGRLLSCTADDQRRV